MRMLVLLLCLLPEMAHAAEGSLGRLFLTPAERTSLDVARSNGIPPATSPALEKTPVKSSIQPFAPSVALQGYVARTDGKSTLWINSKPVQESDSTAAIEAALSHPGTIRIRVTATGQGATLKAGQSYHPDTGRIVDPLGNGYVRPGPSTTHLPPWQGSR